MARSTPQNSRCHVSFEDASKTSSSVRWRLNSSRRQDHSPTRRDSRPSLSQHRPKRGLASWLLSARESRGDNDRRAAGTDDNGSDSSQSSVSAREEAARLRERALQLREEARALEVEVQRSRLAGASRRQRTLEDMMHHMFPSSNSTSAPPTPQRVAQILRDERWTVDQAVLVLEALEQRRKIAATIRMDDDDDAVDLMSVSQPPVKVAFHDEADLNFTLACVDALLKAAIELDEESVQQKVTHHRRPTDFNSRWSDDGRGYSTLKNRWNEWHRNGLKELERQLNVKFGGADAVRGIAGDARRAPNATLLDGARITAALGGAGSVSNSRRGPEVLDWATVKESMGVFPAWVPSSLVPYVAAAATAKATAAAVSADDVKLIKDKVLANSNFFCTSTESTPSAALFRGNIRLTDEESSRNRTAGVWDDIQRRMDREGVSNRVQLLFLPDPEWKVGKDPREPLPRPVVLALSQRVQPDDSLMEQGTLKLALKRFSYVAALTTGFAYSVRCMSLNERFFDSIMTMKNAAALQCCVPIMAGLLGVQAVHELAHLLVARRNGIRTGFPVPLPAFSTGLFGCITPLRSFPATRTALFDFAMSGPLSALLLSVGLMGFGVLQTVRASKAALSQFPFVPASLLKSSLLSGSILTCLAPKVMMLPVSQPVPISPWYMVGFAGSIASALNLLPIYRLDGGRACAAAMGQRFAAVASTASLLFLLSISFNPDSYGIAFWWAMAVVLFQRKPDIPARNDVTEIGEYRVGAWLTSLAASILTLAPFPGANGIL